MIKNFSAKELIGFDSIELEFCNGLNVFSGPSGAGKSVLLGGILSAIGLEDAKATFTEVQTKTQIFRAVKKEKSRWFLDDEPISKKLLAQTSSEKILYLSAHDAFAFSKKALLELLDDETKTDYDINYSYLQKAKKDLDELLQNASKIDEKREFLIFEINKIETINPKIEELQELQERKKIFSQKEKLQTLIAKLSPIVNMQGAVVSLFDILKINVSIADEFYAEFSDALSNAETMLQENDDIDKIMERLEELNYLVKKYGSIKEALEAKTNKQQELKSLEQIDEAIFDAKKILEIAQEKLLTASNKLSKQRKQTAKNLQEKTNKMLSELKLKSCDIKITQCEPDAFGADNCEIYLNETKSDKISSGETRRLRLALLAASANTTKEAIILDEADANLSGEESAAVASLIKELAKKYQIFAITHQAQTAAVAQRHFLVTKQGNISYVTILQDNERINEIARMISGDNVKQEAISFATKLLDV